MSWPRCKCCTTSWVTSSSFRCRGLIQSCWSGRKPTRLRVRAIDDPGGKFRAFGWHVLECDGHDHASIREALDAAAAFQGQPTCVVAHTVKGKGISYMEGDFNWHAKVPNDDQLATALSELDDQIAAIGNEVAA